MRQNKNQKPANMKELKEAREFSKLVDNLGHHSVSTLA
jgi:hypothetical protein